MFWQHLAKYEIAVPNISVQKDIVAQCSEIDETLEGLTSRLATSKQLAGVLTGELAGAA